MAIERADVSIVLSVGNPGMQEQKIEKGCEHVPRMTGYIDDFHKGDVDNAQFGEENRSCVGVPWFPTVLRWSVFEPGERRRKPTSGQIKISAKKFAEESIVVKEKPKRTGKSNLSLRTVPEKKVSGKDAASGAKDPAEDFDKPLTKPGSPASEEAKQQGELIDIEPKPAVQHGKMAAHFVRFVPDRNKDRKAIVYLDFSLELEDAHSGRLPAEVEDEWKHFKRGSVDYTEPSGMGSQNLQLSIAPDSDVDLVIVAAMPKAAISRVVQKGEGKERKVIRLQMRFLTSFTDDVARFCQNNFDETLWISMKASQRSFGEDEED